MFTSKKHCKVVRTLWWTLYTSLASGCRRGTICTSVFVDFSKAFDHVYQNILTAKLTEFGLLDVIIQWMCSFLLHRCQHVKIGLFLHHPMPLWHFDVSGIVSKCYDLLTYLFTQIWMRATVEKISSKKIIPVKTYHPQRSWTSRKFMFTNGTDELELMSFEWQQVNRPSRGDPALNRVDACVLPLQLQTLGWSEPSSALDAGRYKHQTAHPCLYNSHESNQQKMTAAIQWTTTGASDTTVDCFSSGV